MRPIFAHNIKLENKNLKIIIWQFYDSMGTRIKLFHPTKEANLFKQMLFPNKGIKSLPQT